MKYRVVIFEAEGGSDKGLDGHRRDTMPIINALIERGWDARVIYFRDEWKDKIFDYVKDWADAYVSRVNPGNLPNGETIYFETLTKLSDHGVIGMPTPDIMMRFGAKDVLEKLVPLGMVPKDTYSYYTIESFKENFPKSLSTRQRVLKQNRGSTGQGIWRVQIEDKRKFVPGEALPLDTKIKCTEAVDNHVEHHTLADFMEFCEQYIVGENGMLVDMAFLHRITEGEIRILLVGKTPVFVVHKVPAQTEDAFSATLFSGATYTYDSPEKWQGMIDFFIPQIPAINDILDVDVTPLIWTADFMLDDGPDGKDIYVLGEINCSCVGFTSELDMGIQDKVAEEIIETVKSKLGK